MEFKDRLKDLWAAKPISAIELAQKLGLSESAIRMWESGRSFPTIGNVLEMARIFNVSTDYLLGQSDDKSPGFRELKKRAAADTIKGLITKDMALKKQINLLEKAFKVEFGEEAFDFIISQFRRP